MSSGINVFIRCQVASTLMQRYVNDFLAMLKCGNGSVKYHQLLCQNPLTMVSNIINYETKLKPNLT